MGKYMRKPKTTRDIDVSHSPLGVRTRARTLALQRLKSSATDTTAAIAGADYLELRSRRLEKPPLLKQYLQDSQRIPVSPKHGFVCIDKQNPQIEGSRSGSVDSCYPIEPAKEADGCSDRLIGGFEIEIGDMEIEASFGENNLDLEPRERCTRESTPCSMIRAADSSSAPGSSTKQRNGHCQRAQNAVRNIPAAREIDEFFACAEQPQQRLFMEKYNFDIVKDLPLPGRYEWVRVTP